MFYLVKDEGQHTWPRSCHTPDHLHTRHHQETRTDIFLLVAFKHFLYLELILLLVLFINTDKCKWLKLLLIYEETVAGKKKRYFCLSVKYEKN